MKIYRYIQNYKVQILEESFVLNDENTLVNTAKISFYDINNNLIDTKKYGVIDLDNIYNKILNKELQKLEGRKIIYTNANKQHVIDVLKRIAVSYTHLTLPTILLV